VKRTNFTQFARVPNDVIVVVPVIEIFRFVTLPRSVVAAEAIVPSWIDACPSCVVVLKRSLLLDHGEVCIADDAGTLIADDANLAVIQ
jgi:hypothetical protein